MTQRVSATVKQNPNQKVSVKQPGSAGARMVGIPGSQGGVGEQGIQGVPGDQGVAGPTGMSWKGAYGGATEYSENDAVSYAGSSYIYTFGTPTTGNSPPDPTYWDVLAGAGTSGDKSYVHVESVAASVWTIVHGLGKFPSVSVVDSGLTEVEGDVQYLDPNTVQITFSAAFSGRAYLN